MNAPSPGANAKSAKLRLLSIHPPSPEENVRVMKLRENRVPRVLAAAQLVCHGQQARGHCTPVSPVDPGPPGSHADGWDCADAIAEGWTVDQLHEFMSNRVSAAEISRPAPAPAPAQVKAYRAPSHAADGGDWRDRLILSKGQPRECVPNVIEK